MARKPEPQPPLAPWVLGIVSAGIVFHLSAVVVAALNVPARYNEQSSPLTQSVWRQLHPYLDGAYVNHGYKFFAPDPGRAIHLLSYRIEHADGRQEVGYLPDAQKYWPRLRYHRHFMLSDQMLGGDPQKVDAWAQSFAAHLKKRSGGKSVALYHCWHRTPSPQEVLDGMTLGDPRLYVNDLSDGPESEADRKFGPQAWTLIGVDE